jgi:DNA polymerase-3 subunit chi
MKQADFYILPCADDDGKFDFLGKLLTRITGADHQVFIYCNDEFSAQRLSDALWNYKDISFLANIIIGADEKPSTPTITLGWNPQHKTDHLDVMINYCDEIPEGAANFERVVELVTQQPLVLQRSRERYKNYRDQGFNIKNNDMRKRTSQ